MVSAHALSAAEPVAAAAPGRGTRLLLLGAITISGAAGLIHQVAWIRRASLAFGSTVHATSTVLAVFFLGLALGSAVFGGLATRTARPLRAAGILELALATLALAALPAFGAAEALYGEAYRALEGGGPLLAARAGLVACVLLPPAFLIGGTLPLFCRALARRTPRLGRDLALLYGLNTLGAAAGCALAGFALIPGWGVASTVAAGAALNGAAGVVLLALDRRTPPAAEPARAGGAMAERASLPAIAAVLALGGFATLGLEVVWTRFLGLVVRQTVTTYTLALAVVLLGIVAGSALAARLPGRRGPGLAALGLLQAGAGLLALGLMRQPPEFWRAVGGETAVAFALLLGPAVLSGAAFPLGLRLAAGDAARAPGVVGRLTAINTAGGIAGALAAGFVLLPRGGLSAALDATAGASVAAGLVAWLAPGEAAGTRRALAVLGVAGWLLAPRLAATRLPADFLAPREELVSWREGIQAHLAVVRREGRLELELDRWWQGQDAKTHQVVAAHLPMLIHPGPRRVLVVGAGAGQTPSRFLMHDPERVDVVDIEPAVFAVIRQHFDAAWMDDPRVRLVPGDGRDLVAHGGGRWDVISIEVGQIHRPGVGAFYTREFYRRARARLRPGGVISQFVPLAFLTPETFRSVLATFLAEFPNASLWFNTSELLLVGAADSLPAPRLARVAHDPRLAADLDYFHYGGPRFALRDPAVLAGSFLAGPAGLAALAAGAPVLTDDRPLLEYATRSAGEGDAREVPIARLLRARLDPLPAGFPARASEVRDLNLGELEAAAHLRRALAARKAGDPAGTLAACAAARTANPANLEARRLAGEAHLKAGRFADAEAELRVAVAGDPADAGARRALAVALHQTNRVAEAIPLYREALRLDPDDAEAHNNLGAALAGGGDLEAALPHFERAARLRPGYVEAAANAGRVRAALGRASEPPIRRP